MRAWPLLVVLLTTAAATHPDGSGPRSLGGATVPEQPVLLTLEAEAFTDLANGSLVRDAAATGGTAWRLDRYGVISTRITVPATGVVWLEVRARGEHPEGLMNTHMHPLLDGAQRGEWDLRGGEWRTYRQAVPVLAGEHDLGVDNFNNYHAPALDRTLLVDWVRVSQPTLEGAPVVGAAPVVVDGPDVHAAGTGRAETGVDARDGTQWLMWGVGCFVEAIVLETDGAYEATPRLKGNERGGVGSHVTVHLDGARLDEFTAGDAWMERTVAFEASAGAHVLEICYDNDYGGDLKRNLWMDDLTLRRVQATSLPAPAWPTAHGGLLNHRNVASALRPDAGALAEAWRYETRGAVTGTPVHADGVAYFGDWSGRVHAVRIADGSRVWQVEHGAGVDSSLAVDGDRLLVADMAGALSARDRATGDLLWRTEMDVPGTHLYGSPVLHEGRILLGVASQQTDLSYEGDQDFRGSVASVDAETGRIQWQTYLPPPDGRGISVWSTPAVDAGRGLLFVGTGNAYGPPAGPHSDAVVALRVADGSIAWSFQGTQNDTFNARGSPGPDHDFGSSPLLVEAGGRALVVDGDKGGRYYALDRDTGEQVWRTKVDFIAPGASLVEKEGFIGTAAFHEGVLFAPTTDRSMVHALDAATGEVLWATELNEKPKSYGERMFGSTTASGGVILQGTAFGGLFLLDAGDGRILQEVDVGGDVQGGVSLAGDVILVPHGGDEMWDARGGVAAFRIPKADAPPADPPARPTLPDGAKTLLPEPGLDAWPEPEDRKRLAWGAWPALAALAVLAALPRARRD